MGLAGRDDGHRARLGGKDLVTHLDCIRPLQKAKNFELMAMHMERWSGSRTGDFLEDGKGVACRGRRDLDGDRNPGQGDFLAGVCRDEQVLGLRPYRLPLRGWTARVCRLYVCGTPMRHPLLPTCMAPSAREDGDTRAWGLVVEGTRRAFATFYARQTASNGASPAGRDGVPTALRSGA